MVGLDGPAGSGRAEVDSPIPATDTAMRKPLAYVQSLDTPRSAERHSIVLPRQEPPRIRRPQPVLGPVGSTVRSADGHGFASPYPQSEHHSFALPIMLCRPNAFGRNRPTGAVYACPSTHRNAVPTLPQPQPIVRLCLEETSKTSTSALARLILFRRRLLRGGGDLRIAGLSGRTTNLYEICRMTRLLPRCQHPLPPPSLPRGGIPGKLRSTASVTARDYTPARQIRPLSQVRS